jgi:hypothetical protein
MPKVEWNSKISKFEHLVTRAKALPLSAENKADVIAAAPIARLFHGCELSSLDFDSLKKLRTTVLRTLWTGRSGCIPEILTCLIFPGHSCDPIQVVAFRSLCTLRSMCLKNPQIFLLAKDIWQSHLDSPNNQFWGPIRTATTALTILNWGWHNQFEVFTRVGFSDFRWLDCSKSFFRHEVRSAMRQHVTSCFSLCSLGWFYDFG